MHTFTAFPGAGLDNRELGGILADYLALDQTRIFRRLLVMRFGGLAVLALVVGLVIPHASWAARLGSVALFLIPPAWAWIRELRLERRLSIRLKQIEGIATTSVSEAGIGTQGDKKVVKSS
jgi:hypothetical protein